MKRKIGRMISLIVLVASSVMLVGSPTQAAASLSAHPDCLTPNPPNGPDWKSWRNASWGRGRVCYDAPTTPPMTEVRVQSDDTLTDGYCVHVEFFQTPLNIWSWHPDSESCGPIAITPYLLSGGAGSQFTMIRLVRGPCIDPPGPNICNGVGVNFLTLYP